MRAGQRSRRNSLLAAAAAAVVVGFAASAGGVLLRLIDGIRIGFVPTSYSIGRGFDIAHDLLLLGAFAVACLAFLGPAEARGRRLAITGVIAAIGFAGSVMAEAIYAGVNGTHEMPALLVASCGISALAAVLFVGAAVSAITAFTTGSPDAATSQRNDRLGWAAIGTAVGLALTTTAQVLYIDGVTPLAGGDAGLRLEAVGSGIAAIAAGMAAGALLASRRDRQHPSVDSMLPRQALLALAFTVFAIAFLLRGIGQTIAADDSSAALVSGLVTTAHLLDAASSGTVAAAAAMAAVGCLVSRRSTANDFVDSSL
jgi:hypothetical protein